MPVGNSARLEDRGDRLAMRLGALAGVARAAWAGSRAELLRQVAHSAHAALGVASVSIAEWEPELGRIRVHLNYGDLAPHEVALPEDEYYSVELFGYLREVIEELRGWSSNIETGDPNDSDVQLLMELGKHCSISAPIPLDGRIWGELYLTRSAEQPCFDATDVDMALVVAAQIGAALATADHLTEVEELAHTDPLTGLANRRAVDEVLDSSFARHLSEGVPVSLIVCDLNGLKRINDDQGHDAGDRALVRFAGMLTSAASRLPGALPARLGGDEFCIVAPLAAANDVVSAADELCRLVLKSPLEGVSCGVASTADDVGDVDSPGRLFRLADAAQYRAKRSRSHVPVVAGRSLPEGVADHLAHQGTVTSGDRRVFRGREMSDAVRIMRAGLDVLDDTRGEATQARLASVADLLAQQTDALGWWLSIVRPGSERLVTRQFALFRQQNSDSEQPGAEPIGAQLGNEYALSDYPATSPLMDGGVLVVNAGDPDADAAELDILTGMSALSVAMGGCRDERGTGWLIEIYGDALSQSMNDVGLAMRVLMAVAVHEAHLPPVPTSPN